jgi:hypothetical protein
MCSSNTEPTLEELLSDPVARLLMARDGLQPEQIWACVGSARRKLMAATTPERKTADPRHPPAARESE